MKTFNKKGDRGDTSLLFGQRVAKSDLRCEAYGTIDEAVSALGIARNFVTRDKVKEIITNVQKELFTVGAEMATRPEDLERLASSFTPVTEDMVDKIEGLINELEAKIELPKAFIIPGSNAGSSFVDLARAMVRRSERRAVVLMEKGEINNDAILRYLNRLADLLFIVARYEETSE